MPRPSRFRFKQRPVVHRFSTPSRFWRRMGAWGLFLLTCGVAWIAFTLGTAPGAEAQQSGSVRSQEEQLIREFVLPAPPRQAPVYRPAPAAPVAPAPALAPAPAATRPAASTPSQEKSAAAPTPARPATTKAYEYVLEFNRSPVIGNRFRMEGTLAGARLGFTRPRNWTVKSAKAIVRFQHSPSLVANRSNLTVRVNDTSIGSVPLNRSDSEIGQVVFNIPPRLLQDYNELAMLTQQTNASECPNPSDPTLWTEVLPDSRIVFEFEPQPVRMDLARYPYPVMDVLGLDPDRLAYLKPKEVDEAWMTAAARLQSSLAMLSEFHSVESRVISSLSEAKDNERIVIIGTPANQPTLSSLKLPFALQGNQVMDGNKSALPGDVGVLMLTTTKEGAPVLIATGNDVAGVEKAVQFAVQPDDRQQGAGQAILVNSINDVPTPPARDMAGFLPNKDTFQLSDLKLIRTNQPFQDVTVTGAAPPPVEINFHALPDDRFLRGSTMNLDFSYGPQINPRKAAVEVRLDGVAVGGKQLTSTEGGRETLLVNLPEELIRPNSVLAVRFSLPSRDVTKCGAAFDPQIWATVHASTRFNLKRENAVQLPDLKLLQTGFPLTAPQDLSSTALVLPDSPNNDDLNTMLELGNRLGRLADARSVKLDVYRSTTLPADVRNQKHLVGIGTRDRFPLPEVFQVGGMNLGNFFSRQNRQSQVQALGDAQGMVKSVVSPWNKERILIGLTGQTSEGLKDVQDLLSNDPLFFQMQGDTVLVSRNQAEPSPYDASGYNLAFLQETQPQTIDRSGPLSRASNFLQNRWFMLPVGMVAASLLFFGIIQFYLNRLSRSGGAR